MTRRGAQELQSDGRENSRGEDINDEEKLLQENDKSEKKKERNKNKKRGRK